MFADALTHHLEEQEDLRFLVTLPTGGRIAVFAEILPWDSNFFNYGIAKLNAVFPLEEPLFRPKADYKQAVSALLEVSRRKGVRYLFATVDPRDLALLRSLGELGFALIETRAYYHMDLRTFVPTERYPVRAARTEDVARLGATAQQCMNLYDRFHSDPVIADEDADRIMYKWVEASISEGFADVTIVPDRPDPTAFCTVKYHKDKWGRWGMKVAQPVFSAVGPEYRGWYKKIISEVNCHLIDIGAEHAYLATQLTNKAVVRVWETLGYRYGKGEHILRIVL
jgi:dTDP-4-amino-4,6-dideoxy-D-galactose acyltransferase